jgi:hypothetical protein
VMVQRGWGVGGGESERESGEEALGGSAGRREAPGQELADKTSRPAAGGPRAKSPWPPCGQPEMHLERKRKHALGLHRKHFRLH